MMGSQSPIFDRVLRKRLRRSPRYYHALAGLFPSKDIVVHTPAEVEEWSGVPHAFVTTAVREGKVLYGDAE